MEDLKQKLEAILVSERSFVKEMEPMSRHTTFRIGGPAAFYAAPGDEAELAALLRLCRRENVPVRILGNGSNLLVSDRGLDGVVVAMEENWNYGGLSGENTLRAGAGLLLSRAAGLALKHSLTGLEFAAGIPGTVGGAVMMNAGAYGSEMKNVILSVRVMDQEGQVRVLDGGQMEFGYRTSCVASSGYVVLEAVMALEPGDAGEIRARMDDLAARRREKQPLEFPSAGSTFKRPAGYFAGKLIQDSGLQGQVRGGAQVSEKHCGFVINRGGATAADVLELCGHVQATVKEKFGVDLEMEVRRWGEF
ncbi:MAG: UDP-N-acetylmuramate dehydrogenase [Enterocloster asparagiformis]|nr:UDP-N-acetylmuramate dehydrogenase [Enterocloster asparagiformis]